MEHKSTNQPDIGHLKQGHHRRICRARRKNLQGVMIEEVVQLLNQVWRLKQPEQDDTGNKDFRFPALLLYAEQPAWRLLTR